MGVYLDIADWMKLARACQLVERFAAKPEGGWDTGGSFADLQEYIQAKIDAKVGFGSDNYLDDF